jgi:putative membrane protein
MRQWLLHWVLSAVALLIVANVVPGIEVESFGSALAAAVVIGVVSATVGLLLKIILLPFIILTLGIVYFLVNGMMLMLSSAIVPGFRVKGLMAATLGAIALTVVDYLLNRLV